MDWCGRYPAQAAGDQGLYIKYWPALTDRLEQTVLEQSHLGLHCLPFHMHLLKVFCYCKIYSSFRVITAILLRSKNLVLICTYEVCLRACSSL